MSRARLYTVLLVACLSSGISPNCPAADSLPVAAASPRCLALIVGGAPGNPMYARHYADWLGRFHKSFKSAGVQPADLIVLTTQKDVGVRTGDATVESIQLAISNLVAHATPQDQFVLVLIGHGQPDGSLALAGPDIAPDRIAEALAPLSAKQQIVLGFSSCSGALIPALAKTGRIIITATSPEQRSDSEFAEFFLLALEAKDKAVAPGSAKSLLDLFNTASNDYAQWITHQCQPGENAGPGWIVQGRRSREIFRKLYGDDDVPETMRMLSTGGNEAEDEVMPFVPGATPDAAFWTGRRMPNGTPLLEDTGRSEGITTLGEKGYVPITGTQSVGLFAKRTLLGRPEGSKP